MGSIMPCRNVPTFVVHTVHLQSKGIWPCFDAVYKNVSLHLDLYELPVCLAECSLTHAPKEGEECLSIHLRHAGTFHVSDEGTHVQSKGCRIKAGPLLSCLLKYTRQIRGVRCHSLLLYQPLMRTTTAPTSKILLPSCVAQHVGYGFWLCR